MSLIHLLTALVAEETGVGAALPGPLPSLLDVINAAELPLGQSCRGVGICRSCGVWADASAGALSPPTDREDAAALPDGWRLACQARVATPELVCAPTSPEGRVDVRLWHPAWGVPEPERDPGLEATRGGLERAKAGRRGRDGAPVLG